MQGTGQVGTHILNALLDSSRFTVTAITRSDSSATFPRSVKVAKGNYEDEDFFVKALGGQDALIIAISFMAPPELQNRLIAAAAKACVPWVLPNEFGSDNAHPIMSDIPTNGPKKQYRDEIEKLGKSSWIGIVNNPWYEFVGGFFLTVEFSD